jgi:hypothetical protein
MIPPVRLTKSARRRERAKRSSARPEARATDDFLYTEGRTLDLGRSDVEGVWRDFRQPTQLLRDHAKLTGQSATQCTPLAMYPKLFSNLAHSSPVRSASVSFQACRKTASTPVEGDSKCIAMSDPESAQDGACRPCLDQVDTAQNEERCRALFMFPRKE